MPAEDRVHPPSNPDEVMRKIEHYFASTPAQEVIDQLQRLMPRQSEIETEDPSLSQLAGELAWYLREGTEFTAATFGKVGELALSVLDRLQASLAFLSADAELEAAPQYLSSSVRQMLVLRRDNLTPTFDRLVQSNWYRKTRSELQSLMETREVPHSDMLRDYRGEFSALASFLAEAAL